MRGLSTGRASSGTIVGEVDGAEEEEEAAAAAAAADTDDHHRHRHRRKREKPAEHSSEQQQAKNPKKPKKPKTEKQPKERRRVRRRHHRPADAHADGHGHADADDDGHDDGHDDGDEHKARAHDSDEYEYYYAYETDEDEQEDALGARGSRDADGQYKMPRSRASEESEDNEESDDSDDSDSSISSLSEYTYYYTTSSTESESESDSESGSEDDFEEDEHGEKRRKRRVKPKRAHVNFASQRTALEHEISNNMLTSMPREKASVMSTVRSKAPLVVPLAGPKLVRMLKKKVPIIGLLKAKMKASKREQVPIPAPFLKLLASTSLKSRGRVKPVKFVLRTISNIYADKIVADAVDEKEGNRLQTLPEFIYDFHLHQYGLRKLAEKQLLDLLLSVAQYSLDHPRITMFARFCELIGPPLPLQCLGHYLRVLSTMRSMVDSTNYKSQIWLRPIDSEEEQCKVLVAHVLGVIHRSYAFSNPKEMAEFAHNLLSRLHGNSYKPRSQVDLDRMLALLVDDYAAVEKRFSVTAQGIFAASIDPKSPLMTLEQFQYLIPHLDNRISNREIDRHYRMAMLEAKVQLGAGIPLFAFEHALERLGIPTVLQASPNMLSIGQEVGLNRVYLDRLMVRFHPFLQRAADEAAMLASKGGQVVVDSIIRFQEAYNDDSDAYSPVTLWVMLKFLMEDIRNFRIAQSGNKKKVRSALVSADTFYPDLSMTSEMEKDFKQNLVTVYKSHQPAAANGANSLSDNLNVSTNDVRKSVPALSPQPPPQPPGTTT
eukprot:comp22353_c0_seq2/m.53927 comp22353_c0_seq2/g.53927  ORF comp22353_c0_seq2/g.53927 comp22353_c0_seq2/m.53927 type:complete len:773 (-) comp22353_c0_seq2:127-2445(-)